MPLPTPRKGESKNLFISRFVKATKGEFAQNQAVAVAIKQWDESKRKRNK